MSELAVKVENLIVTYGRTTAVDNLSFQVKPGEIYGLLGPNGAGKSSTLKVLVGILEPNYGKVEVFGNPISREAEVKKLIGYVPEETTLLESLTPREFFEFVASVRGLNMEVNSKLSKLVSAFELNEYFDTPLAALSMGNKRKVAVIAALLHDPPLLILDEPLIGLDARSSKILKELMVHHAEKGGAVVFSTHIMEIAEKILRNCKLYEAKEYLIGINSDYVKQSDHLAASVDRWLLSKLVGKSYSSFSVNEIKMKNIFNPKFSIKIDGKLDDRQVDEFAKRLNLILKDIQDVDLVYHVLYACYEATWISCNLPAGPADTRVPSHSVFDHNYATASMMNWLIKSKSPKGILLFIDLGGPQKFISNSRKLRDLWISSYLASALAWRLFWILIRRLGPDVMILPTCRGNPFYYHSLISELYQKNIDEKIINEIKKLAKEVVENYDPDEDVIPRYAVIPVTATFILPDIDVLKQFNDFRNIESLEDLKKLVENEYSRIWKDMYETIVENCSQLKNDLGKLAEKSKELLEKCRNYGFDQTPPFPIRVVAIHTDELYKIGFPTSEEEQYSLYHYMFKLLAYKESREKIYRFRPEENLKLYDMTSNPIESWKESKRGFDYCSLCGYLPAIIIMPSNEEEFKSESLDLRIEPIFSFGERLCPYCLIKRLLSISGILKPVMDKLLGKVSNKELHYIRFLSVTDIALIPFKFSIVNAVRKIDEAPDKYHLNF
ncbi:MAG: type III-B CRISPR-associated protein Cas10/Cmr2 [Candidatus Bathyarchaeia archaeon]